MENKFMKFVNENKWFVVFFLIWLFIHLILLISGDDTYGFWPFYDLRVRYYGFIEFFVYVSLPLLVFAIIKLVGKDIKKAIDENN